MHATPGGYLLFFGRIHPDKGAVEAIDAAERCGIPLVIAGIVQDERYFEELVAPRIDGDRVSFVGAVGSAERLELLGGGTLTLREAAYGEPIQGERWRGRWRHWRR